MKTVLIFTILTLVSFSNTAIAYVYCVTKVKEIQAHISNGNVYFVFEDGTAIHQSETNSGLERNMSIALAALMAGREVKVALHDGYQCGTNATTNWTYIIAI